MMNSMRESWTDKRLDDLNEIVDRGFDRVDAEIRAHRVETRTEFGALRGETKAGFDRVDERFERIDGRFERIDERFERINERFDALHRLLIQSAGVLLAALVGLHFV
jgi:hypothetical protein